MCVQDLYCFRLGSLRESSQPIFEQHYHLLNPSINVLLHYEAILNTINTIPALAEQLVLIEKLQVNTIPALAEQLVLIEKLQVDKIPALAKQLVLIDKLQLQPIRALLEQLTLIKVRLLLLRGCRGAICIARFYEALIWA